MGNKKYFLGSLVAAWFLLLGAGPILVDTDSTGLPVVWKDGVIRYNTETGTLATLGTLSNNEAVALVQELFDDWKNVTIDDIATTDLTIVEGSGLGEVDTSNLDDIFTYCPPDEVCLTTDPPFVTGTAETGESPILFDDDGSMTDAINGEGASSSLLGFGGPRVVERINGVLYITESEAVLNGKFINGVSSASDPEVTIEDFKGVIFHELGHFIGLDHTQLNLNSFRDFVNGDESEEEAIPTMLAFFVEGMNMLTPHFDDKVAVSMLYPSASYESSFCTLQGTVYQADGVTELQGVNVVVTNESDPLDETTSFVSGSYFTGSSSSCSTVTGDYAVTGLTPGRTYALSIEKISQSFTGGSSIEPCDPPQTGFDAKTVSGVYSCSSGGEIITAGSVSTTDIITSKTSAISTGSGGSDSDDADGDSRSSGSGGGCSVVP